MDALRSHGLLQAEQAVITAVICRQQRYNVSTDTKAQDGRSPASASPVGCFTTHSDTALLMLRPGLPNEGAQRALPAQSAPLPAVRHHGSAIAGCPRQDRAAGVPEYPMEIAVASPPPVAEPRSASDATSNSNAFVRSSRLMLDDDQRALDQLQHLGPPFLGDCSRRPSSYCSSRSNSGDGAAVDASSSAAPPSSAAVTRYGSLLMGSAGWRCTAVYGIDLHDMLLLDRMTPRRTSARQQQPMPPPTAQQHHHHQQRTSRPSTPELSAASCAAALRAASSVRSVTGAAPVAAAVAGELAVGEAHVPAGRGVGSPGTAPPSGVVLGTPPRPGPCTGGGRPPRGPPAAAATAPTASARDFPPSPFSLDAAAAAGMSPPPPSSIADSRGPSMLRLVGRGNVHGASAYSTSTKSGAASFHRSPTCELQRPGGRSAAPLPQAVTPNASQPPQPQLSRSATQGAIRTDSPQIISTRYANIFIPAAASLSEEEEAGQPQSAVSPVSIAGQGLLAGQRCSLPRNSIGVGISAARHLLGITADVTGRSPRALGSSPNQPTAQQLSSPHTSACRTQACRRLSESQAAKPPGPHKGCAEPMAASQATPADSAAQHAITSLGGARCSEGSLRPHLGGPDLLALSRQEGGATGSAGGVSGLRTPSQQRTPGRLSGRGGSLTSWASVSSLQGQLPPPPSAVRFGPGAGSGYDCGTSPDHDCRAGGSLDGEGGRSLGLTTHPSASSLLGDSGTPHTSRRTSYHSCMVPASHTPQHPRLQPHSHSCTGASPAGYLGIRSGSVASWGEVLGVLREQVTPRAASGRAGGSPFCASPAALAAAATVSRGRTLMSSSFEGGRSNYQSNGGCSPPAPSDGGCGSGCGTGWAAAVLGRMCCTPGRGERGGSSVGVGNARRASGEDFDTGGGTCWSLVGALPCVARDGASCDGDACGSAARCRQASNTPDMSWWRKASLGNSISTAKSGTIHLAAAHECDGRDGRTAMPDVRGGNQAACAWKGGTGAEEEAAEGKGGASLAHQPGVAPDTVAERDEDAVEVAVVAEESEASKTVALEALSSLDRLYADARRNSFAPLSAAVFEAQRPLEPSTAAPQGKALQTSLVAAGALVLATCLSPRCGREQATVSPRDAC